MRDLLKNEPALAKTPEGQVAGQLLEYYKSYENAISTLTNSNSSSSQITDTTNGWKQYLYNVAAKDPQYVNLITGLFLSIPTSRAPATNISNTATPGVFRAKSWNAAA